MERHGHYMVPVPKADGRTVVGKKRLGRCSYCGQQVRADKVARHESSICPQRPRGMSTARASNSTRTPSTTTTQPSAATLKGPDGLHMRPTTQPTPSAQPATLAPFKAELEAARLIANGTVEQWVRARLLEQTALLQKTRAKLSGSTEYGAIGAVLRSLDHAIAKLQIAASGRKGRR